MSEVFVPSKDKLYPEIYIDNFRDFLNSIHKYSSKTAFCFKDSKTKEITKITYKQYIDDIIGFSTTFRLRIIWQKNCNYKSQQIPLACKLYGYSNWWYDWSSFGLSTSY